MAAFTCYTNISSELPTKKLSLTDLTLYVLLASFGNNKAFSKNKLSRFMLSEKGSRGKNKGLHPSQDIVTTSLRHLVEEHLLTITTNANGENVYHLTPQRGALVPIRTTYLWSKKLTASANGLLFAMQLHQTSVNTELAKMIRCTDETIATYKNELRSKSVCRFRSDGSVVLMSEDGALSVILVSKATSRPVNSRRKVVRMPKRSENPTPSNSENPAPLNKHKTYNNPSFRKVTKGSNKPNNKKIPERTTNPSFRKDSKEFYCEKTNLNPFKQLPDVDLISSIHESDRAYLRELNAYIVNRSKKYPDDAVVPYICERTDLYTLLYVLRNIKGRLGSVKNIGAYFYRALRNTFEQSRRTDEERAMFVETKPSVMSADQTRSDIAKELDKEYQNEPDLADRCRDQLAFRTDADSKAFLRGLERDYLAVFLKTYHQTDYSKTRMGQEYARLRRVLAFLDSPFHYAEGHPAEVRSAFWQIDAGDIQMRLRHARKVFSSYQLVPYIAAHEDALSVIETAIDAWESGERKTA